MTGGHWAPGREVDGRYVHLRHLENMEPPSRLVNIISETLGISDLINDRPGRVLKTVGCAPLTVVCQTLQRREVEGI